MLDEISDNDIEDDKKESEDETMDTDNDEDVEEFNGEMTEERLAAIKVVILKLSYFIF